MKKNYNLISSADEELARAVAIRVIVTKPVSVWQTLIPFIFFWDFLKRSRTIRLYARNFMFPRKLAINAALDIKSGKDKENGFSRIEEAVKEWLNYLKLYSQGLHQNQMEIITMLIDHYSRLLNTSGDTYYYLVENAYNNRENYDAYLSRLVSAEEKVDRAILEKLGETEELREKILAERKQLEKLRKEEADIIFYVVKMD